MPQSQDLVARLLSTPDISRVVPRLPPEVLHRLIERCGLEECADIVALATPRQFQRVLDIDLWRAPVPGADEGFDGERFGLWLEVLVQSGASAAADRLAAMDVDLVIEGLADHVAVFDGAAVAPFVTLDGAEIPGRAFAGSFCQIGGFVVEARRPSAWDAIVELLAHLRDERAAFFHRVMRGCVALSNGERERDGCDALADDRGQHLSNLAIDRESRRERQGYVAPAQARAFLDAARALRLDLEQPPVDPTARACLSDIAPEPDAVEGAPVAGHALPAAAEGSAIEDAGATIAVMEILCDAGVVPQPRALLAASTTEASRLAPVREFIEWHPSAAEELAFLANALLSGCSIQGRAFTPQEASDGVLATCNLGLENWPARWPERDLVRAFQVGCAVLHRDLCRHAAAVLIGVLAGIECSDRDVHRQLQALRRELKRHLSDGEPWQARQGLEAILMLDAPAWAGLRALIDECPTVHAALTSERLRTIDPASFTFVSRNSEIAAAHEWLATLGSTLVG